MSRQERLKAALRDNLKRRKLQVRGRAELADDGIKPERDLRREAEPTTDQERDRS